MAASSGLNYLDLHPFVRATAHDKLLGCIVGGALGDCIGLYTEFLPKTACEKHYPGRKFSLVDPVTPFAGDTHRDKFEIGSWTDDTDHALLLVLSYIHNDGQILSDDFAHRLKIWIRHGLLALNRLPLGIGRTTSSVVSYPEFATNPEGVALKTWINSSRHAAPNGSLMRTHPLGVMCVGKSLEETFRIAAQISRTTHIDPRCTVSCCAVTGIVRALLRGEASGEADVDEILDSAFVFVRDDNDLRNPGQDNPEIKPVTEDRDRALLDREEYDKHVKASHYVDLQLDEHQKIGYVYKCLGSAVLALRLAMRATSSKMLCMNAKTNLFEETITDLVMQGGDADTNGCTAGALLGAWFGYSRLPAYWLQGLQNHDWMLWKCEALSKQVGIGGEFLEGLQKAGDTAPDGGRGLFSEKELNDRERDLIEKILLKDKARREARAKAMTAQKGLGGWVRVLAGKGE